MSRREKGSDKDPLGYAFRAQEHAASVGFDWPDAFGVIEKIREEAAELETALRDGDVAHARRELGDLLLAAVNLSRFLESTPGEEVLRAAQRFEERFALLQQLLSNEGRTAESCTLDELDRVWERVKVLMVQQPDRGA